MKRKKMLVAILAGILIGMCVGIVIALVQNNDVSRMPARKEGVEDGLSVNASGYANDVEVPEAWTGSFYPSYIPEGFIHEGTCLHEVIYMDAYGSTLAYSETPKGGHVSYDTENASIKSVQINGAEATLIEKEGWSTVIWAANNRLFAVDLYGDVETAMRVAASVTLIQ